MKKILSILLSVLMILSVSATVALAGNGPSEEKWTWENEEGGVETGYYAYISVVELDDDANIKCPVCGESYGLHIESASARTGGESFDFRIWCECGCKWSLHLVDHEGLVYLNANEFEEAGR